MLGQTNKQTKTYTKTQIDSSTIDGNVEFVHSQYSCILTSQVSTVLFTRQMLL